MTGLSEIVLDYNFLECPVCFELFDDTCKMLPCQHTFHKRCLQKILSVEERLECPQCRKLVSEDIELLPRNYFLLSVLDKAKPKPSESDEESLQLQFVIEKSKSEAEVKAREEYLLSQKEKLEYELMLLKSERRGCAAEVDAKSQNSSSSSVCGFTCEGGAKENDGATAALLLNEFGSISICDSSLDSSGKSESPTYDVCCAMSLEDQVTEGFKTLNMYEDHSELVAKLLEIVRAVDAGKNFEGIDLMHMIDYGDLIRTYLDILAYRLKDNSFSASSDPTAAPKSPACGSNCATVSSESSFGSISPIRPAGNAESAVPARRVPFVTESDEDLSVLEDVAGARSHACALPEANPGLGNDYQTYTFDDDDRNLNYAIELSRQLMAGTEQDDLIEEVLIKSKITGVIDQQKQIFTNVHEKVEIQIALLLSRI